MDHPIIYSWVTDSLPGTIPKIRFTTDLASVTEGFYSERNVRGRVAYTYLYARLRPSCHSIPALLRTVARRRALRSEADCIRWLCFGEE